MTANNRQDILRINARASIINEAEVEFRKDGFKYQGG